MQTFSTSGTAPEATNVELSERTTSEEKQGSENMELPGEVARLRERFWTARIIGPEVDSTWQRPETTRRLLYDALWPQLLRSARLRRRVGAEALRNNAQYLRRGA